MKIKPKRNCFKSSHCDGTFFLIINSHVNAFTTMLCLRITGLSVYLSYWIFKPIVVTNVSYDCVINAIKQYFKYCLFEISC